MLKQEYLPVQQNIEYKFSWHDNYLKWIYGFVNAQGGRSIGSSRPVSRKKDLKK